MLTQLLPDVVWGALLGSLITFLGVSLQLRHASREREKERNHALKKESLLQVAEAIAGVYTFLAEFGRPDISAQQHNDSLRGLAGWLDRVHLVGEADTISSLTEAVEYLKKAASDLSIKRLDVQNLEVDLKAKEVERDQLQERQANLSAALQTVAAEHRRGAIRPEQEEGVLAQARQIFDMLQMNQPPLDRLAEEVQSMTAEHRSRQLDLFRAGIEHATEFQKICIPAKELLRRELGMPDADLKRVLSASFDANVPAVNAFLSEIRKRAALPDSGQEPLAAPGSAEGPALPNTP